MKLGLLLTFCSSTSLTKVTSHHLLDYLKKYNFKLIYISDAVSFFHLLKLGRFKTNLARIKNTFILDPRKHSNFLSFEPLALIPVENIFPFNLTACAKVHVLSFWMYSNKIIKQFLGKDFCFDLVWINNPKFSDVIKKISYKKLVYSIEDDLFEFSRIPASLKLNHEKLLEIADLVTVTSIPLLEQLKSTKHHEKVMILRNAVDFSQFNCSNLSLPVEYNLIPEPRIIYVGVMSSWFNLQLVAKVAKALPDASLVMIGPVEISVTEVSHIKNIYFLGSKPHTTLPQYLQYAQIGIIPFSKSKLVESVNPIKLYEYMAAGLPVVSTKWKELADLSSPAFLARDETEFILYIEQILNREITVDHQSITNFARANTWDTRFAQVMHYLQL